MIFLCFKLSVLWLPCRECLWIPKSAADAAAVNYNDIITPLSDGLITLFINGEPSFNNGLISLPRNPANCIILEICFFWSVFLGRRIIHKSLQGFETCLSVGDNACGK